MRGSPLPEKTKKSVRIKSTAPPPHPASHDPEDDILQHRIEQRRLAASPPLTSPGGFSDNFEDYPQNHTPRKGTEGESDVYDVREVTESIQGHSEMLESSISPSVAPFNPFSRTLATIESREQGGGDSGHTAGLNRGAFCS